MAKVNKPTYRNDIWGWKAICENELGLPFNTNRPDPYSNSNGTVWKKQKDGSVTAVFYVQGCPQEWGEDVWSTIQSWFY